MILKNNIDLNSFFFFQKSIFFKTQSKASQTGLEQLEADNIIFWVNNRFNICHHINMLSIKLLTGWKAKLEPLFIH